MPGKQNSGAARPEIELLFIDIRFKAALAQYQPDTLKEKIMVQENAAGSEQRTKLSAQLDACQEDKKTAYNWLALIRDYSKLEGLDLPTLLRLVKRIEVRERKTVNSHDERDNKIYYNFVGFVEL